MSELTATFIINSHLKHQICYNYEGANKEPAAAIEADYGGVISIAVRAKCSASITEIVFVTMNIMSYACTINCRCIQALK